MNQEIQPLFEVDAMKVAVGSTPDPVVAALPKRRQFSAAYKRCIVREANACQVPGRGQAPRLYAARQRVLDQAFVAHPERFTRRHPAPPPLPVQVGINFPKPTLPVPGEAQRWTLNSPQLVSQSC